MKAKRRDAKVSEALHLIKKTFSSCSNPDYFRSHPGTSNHPYVACFYWKESDQKGFKADAAELKGTNMYIYNLEILPQG